MHPRGMPEAGPAACRADTSHRIYRRFRPASVHPPDGIRKRLPQLAYPVDSGHPAGTPTAAAPTALIHRTRPHPASEQYVMARVWDDPDTDVDAVIRETRHRHDPPTRQPIQKAR